MVVASLDGCYGEASALLELCSDIVSQWLTGVEGERFRPLDVCDIMSL